MDEAKNMTHEITRVHSIMIYSAITKIVTQIRSNYIERNPKEMKFTKKLRGQAYAPIEFK